MTRVRVTRAWRERVFGGPTWQRIVIAGRSTHSSSKIPSTVKILFLVFSEKSNVFCSGTKHIQICGDNDDNEAIVAFAT